MKIKFLGHASFLITSDTGTRIITDPYKPGCFDGGIQYGKITEEADIVTISHDHDDHNNTDINGNPTFVRTSADQEVKGIQINGIDVYHDTSEGKERGGNRIFNMKVDDLNIVHLGDLGHDLSVQDAERIGNVDVLLVPVGGFFTIDANAAEKVINTLKPKIIIPMHFKTDKCGFPIAPVTEFTQNKEVKKVDGEIEIRKADLPTAPTIYVLSPTK
jgi:L-ascorbate metabolism protein UlaG (beta-lactamase superfamily)